MDQFIFESIRIEGFKSFIEPVTINFEDLGPGLHYLKGENKVELGSNGAGKSSIWDAFCWCLQGRTTDGLRSPDIRPWGKYKGPTSVVIRVEVNGKWSEVKRTHSPNLLTINGKEVAQEHVDHLATGSVEFLTHTMIMGQGQPLFFNRTAKEKMSMFSTVLDLDRWDRRSEFADKKLKERQSQLDALIAHVDAYENQISMLREMILTTKDKSEKWQEQRDAQVAEHEKTIKEVERSLRLHQKLFDEATLAADNAGTQAKLMRKEIEDRRGDLDSARHFHNKAEASLNLLRSQSREMAQELDDIGEGQRCRTCGQSLHGTSLAKHRDHIHNKLLKIKKTLDAGIPLALITAVTIAQKRLTTTIETHDKYLDQEDKAQATVNRVSPIIGQCNMKITMLQKEIASFEEGSNPFRAELGELRRRRIKLEDIRDEKLEKMKSQSALIARTKFWVKGFKDIRLLVIEDVLQQLEIATNSLLQEVGMGKWRVEYAIDRETKAGKVRDGLNVIILSPKNKKAVKWECFSGGESRRLLIVGSLALSRVILGYVGIETNLEVLDEPTQYIDEEGIEDIIELLAERARRLNKVIVYVDHGARESAHFTSTIRVTKTKHGSTIDY